MKILYTTFLIAFLTIGLLQAQSKKLVELTNDVEKILGHGHHHGHHHFHLTPMICDVKIEKNNLVVYVETEAQEIEEDLYDHFLESLQPAVEKYGLQKLKVFIKSPQWSDYKDLTTIDPLKPIPAYQEVKNDDPFPNIRKTEERGPGNPHLGQGLPTGSLSGKVVWLSPGHGWKADFANNNWLTQRGNTNDYVEDFGTVGGIDYYLQQYLMNAGASVWVVRERDVNTNEVVVDNDAGSPSYTSSGGWTTSGSTGYNGGTYQFTNSSATETETATYTPTIPESGWYWVSVQYREGSNRSVDTRYKVNHAGGQTVVSVNQEVHGLTWYYLGQFYFDAGTQGSVVLSNESTEVGQAIIADAVRFGGGMGSTIDCTYGGAPSGRPRFEEAARQYAQFQGYPTCTGDVTIRPKYAEWELAKGAPWEQGNALYLSWHTNAFDGTARGTVTYTYDGSSTPPITPGSVDLATFVQDELINDIWGEWDASWQNRGTKTANFGELRELTTMPGCLVEVAFHDNPDDANALKTPSFRNMAARAMYQGIVKFFNDRDGSPIDLLPEPPTHLAAQNSNTGEIAISWQAPDFGDNIVGDAATSYNVYVSTHGKGFQDAQNVTTTGATLTGLQAGTTYYIQVTALNAGGESFPTATVAVRTPSSGFTPQYLLVDGFDRLDRSALIDQFESNPLGTVDRMFLERMNSYDYMVEHAQGFDYCGISFDGASNEAVISGAVDLNNYAGVDWIMGEESTIDETLDLTEQALLTTYLDNGGNLIISGAEVGWDLGRVHSGNSSTSFYNNYLKSSYAGDDGATYDFVGTAGEIFDGLAGSFDDGTNGYYDSEFPDRITPLGGANTVITYNGGTGDGAAIAYKGSDFGVVNFGFPLESVYDPTLRGNLICDAITFLTPNVCPFDENITNDYNNGDVITIVTENEISANNIVNSGATIIYSAGTQVCLNSGFEVQLGAEFEGFIGGCTNFQEEEAEEKK